MMFGLIQIASNLMILTEFKPHYVADNIAYHHHVHLFYSCSIIYKHQGLSDCADSLTYTVSASNIRQIHSMLSSKDTLFWRSKILVI